MAVDLKMIEGCTEVAPGVLKKNDKTYYIQCIKSRIWCYCNDARIVKLTERYGSLAGIGKSYISRDAKQAARVEVPKKVKSKRGRPSKFTEVDPSTVDDSDPNKPVYQMRQYLKKPYKCNNTPCDTVTGPLLSDNWTRCLRTQLFCKNGGYCNGCAWYDLCKYPDKGWKDYVGQEFNYVAMEKTYERPVHSEVFTEVESRDSVLIENRIRVQEENAKLSLAKYSKK
jgi:hypothetical protein